MARTLNFCSKPRAPVKPCKINEKTLVSQHVRPPGMGFPSPREGRQEGIESLALPNTPQTSPSRIAGIPDLQRGPTGGYGIIVSHQDLGHSIGQSASQSLAS